MQIGSSIQGRWLFLLICLVPSTFETIRNSPHDFGVNYKNTTVFSVSSQDGTCQCAKFAAQFDVTVGNASLLSRIEALEREVATLRTNPTGAVSTGCVTDASTSSTTGAQQPPAPTRLAYSVGYNNHGQLGDGTGFNRSRLVAVRTTWGAGSGVAAVAAGDSFSSFVTTDGFAYNTGSNNNGQGGEGTMLDNYIPAPVSRPWGAGIKVLMTSCGFDFVYFLTSSGQIYSVGANSHGQLGDGTNNPRSTPVLVSQPWNTSQVVQMASGNSHTVFLLANGLAYSVGWNNVYQLGDDSVSTRTIPVRVAPTNPLWGNAPIIAVACTAFSTTVVISNGFVYSVGQNSFGQLGDGTNAAAISFVPVSRPWGNVLIKAVAAGISHTVFLLETGEVYATGLNSGGQLGDNTTLRRSAPVQVVQTWPNGARVVAVACGAYHTLFLLDSGRVFGTGNNTYGQLGDGSTTNRILPVELLPPVAEGARPFAVAVVSGGSHTLVVYDTSVASGSTTALLGPPNSTTSDAGAQRGATT
eukprot:TRINITY_DN3535_c0_g1_i1.p1 TRINITY_DN3535_c0_g1~~TRINITY_DN3535_c0_g1_i1.p1  ORF type:complete len:525 (-),score=96.83 TRINITY_DN3535_c0_g1_i1:390-1964(-)